jgi:hypothetical protein
MLRNCADIPDYHVDAVLLQAGGAAGGTTCYAAVALRDMSAVFLMAQQHIIEVKTARRVVPDMLCPVS